MKFRHQPKRHLRVLVPEAIDDAIRERSMRRSMSEVTTEIMCRGLGIDPKAYGIEPAAEKPSRKPEPAVASA